MIDVRKLQSSVGAAVDGVLGRGTFTALFRKLGADAATAAELAIAANVHFLSYGLLENGLRLAHFLAQLAHESGSFRYMGEIWAPTPAQKGYEGRADLGNTEPGDGRRYAGNGPIQLTGRANHRTFGRLIGIDLEAHPELARVPSIGLHVACEYWKSRRCNDLADSNDADGICHAINGGFNGLAERKALLARIRPWLLS